MLAEYECSREGKRRRAPFQALYCTCAGGESYKHVMKTGDWGGRNVAIDDRLHVRAAILLFVKTQNECRSELTTYGCLGGTPNTW